MESTSIYDLADEILIFLQNGNPVLQNDLEAHFKNKKIYSALSGLHHDNYIIRSTANTYCTISPLGENFIENGGYKIKNAKEAMRAAYSDQLTESLLTTNNSIQSTNSSIFGTNASITDLNRLLKENIPIQNRATWGMLFLTLFAVIISSIALFKRSPKDIQETNKILQNQVQVLKQMQLYQKEMDSSLLIMANDSLRKK